VTLATRGFLPSEPFVTSLLRLHLPPMAPLHANSYAEDWKEEEEEEERPPIQTLTIYRQFLKSERSLTYQLSHQIVHSMSVTSIFMQRGVHIVDLYEVIDPALTGTMSHWQLVKLASRWRAIRNHRTGGY